MHLHSHVPISRLVLVVLLMVAAAQLPAAHAALGQPEATVSADVQHLSGSIKSTERASYTVHEIQLPSGGVLREFAVAGGNVFAISWSGPAIPDLRQALGSYFDVFVAAAKVPHSGHTHLQIQQTGFVMQSAGHMRAYSGRAYVPQSIPAGTSLDEIR
jgi:hypothetical protein